MPAIPQKKIVHASIFSSDSWSIDVLWACTSSTLWGCWRRGTGWASMLWSCFGRNVSRSRSFFARREREDQSGGQGENAMHFTDFSVRPSPQTPGRHNTHELQDRFRRERPKGHLFDASMLQPYPHSPNPPQFIKNTGPRSRIIFNENFRPTWWGPMLREKN